MRVTSLAMGRLCNSNNDSCDRQLLFDVVLSKSTKVSVHEREKGSKCLRRLDAVWESLLLQLLLLLLLLLQLQLLLLQLLLQLLLLLLLHSPLSVKDSLYKTLFLRDTLYIWVTLSPDISSFIGICTLFSLYASKI